MYYASAQITNKHSQFAGIDTWTALFAMMFGAFAIGNTTAFGPDVAKATSAAEKIFAITETESEIDVIKEKEGEMHIDKAHFFGQIEFKDVWFRYPTRKNQWVFKGLNLTINPKDCIAIVGESG